MTGEEEDTTVKADLSELEIPIMDQIEEAMETLEELNDDPIAIPTPSQALEDAKAIEYADALISYTNYFNEIQSAFDIITHADQTFADYLKLIPQAERIEVQQSYNSFKNTKDLSAKKRQYRVFVRTKRATLDKIRSELTKEKTKAEAKANASAGSGTAPARTGSVPASPANIVIKPFRNDNTQSFRTFWNLFSVAYDSNAHIPDVNKLITLISLLEGEPRRLAECIDITDANYRVLVNDLKRRYLNENAIVSELYHQLANLRSCHSPVDEYQFSITLTSLTQQLKGLGRGIENSEMWRTLVSKLTKPTIREIEKRRIQIETSAFGGPWNTETFLEALSEITTQENAIHQLFITDHKKKSDGNNNRSNRNTHRRDERRSDTQNDATMSFPAVTQKAEDDRKDKRSPTRKSNKTDDSNRSVLFAKCAFCGGDHKNYFCKEFKTEIERKKQAYANRLCFRCLKTGHLTKNCTTTITCKKCKKPHNSLVCADWRPRNDFNRANKSSSSSYTVVSKPNQENSNEINEQLVSGATTESNTMAVLMSLEIQVFNPNNANEPTKATILLDPGSQSSFVKKSLVEKLGIEGRSCRNLHLSGINALERADIESVEIELGLQSSNKKFVKVISAYTLDQIVQPHSTLDISPENEDVLNKNRIKADRKMVDPDILLGINYYHDLSIRAEKRLNNGFWLVDSKLGKMISGVGKIAKIRGWNHAQAFPTIALLSQNAITEIDPTIKIQGHEDSDELTLNQ
ncbi:MAG TPA: DUF1759 domain-containing protein, partial [Puia sp.]|nr:DUF1759 domain-containing protein [Puia sp.]